MTQQSRTNTHISTFVEGMDKDTHYTKYSDKRYKHAENFRFITDKDNSTGVLINDVGNTIKIKHNSKHSIFVGWAVIRSDLLLFYTRYHREPNKTFTDLFKVPTLDLVGDKEILLDRRSPYVVFQDKVFGNTHGIKIQALGRRESKNTDKIYWRDDISLKYCIIDSETNNLVESQFESFPEFKLGDIKITNTVAGSLPSGKVQYTYQLYNVRGSSSLCGQFTRLFNLYEGTQKEEHLIRGTHSEKSTGKGCVVELKNLDYLFDRVRVYRVHYGSINLEPDVIIIHDSPVPKNDEKLIIEDNTLTGIRQTTVEDIINTKVEIVPNTMEVKNNILFAANVREKINDIELEVGEYKEEISRTRG